MRLSRPPCSLPTEATHQVALALMLLIAVATGACGKPQPALDPSILATVPAIDWNLLVQGPDERRTRDREERLGAGPVRIPGYIVPLDDLPFDQELVRLTEFLLVPYVGACIHYPPPPPDQMIHVRMAPGEAASLDILSWDPLEVAGTLRMETLESVYGEVGYRMDGIAIGEYSGWELDAAQETLDLEGVH